MRRWGLVVALLLSLGVNLGLIGMAVARRALAGPSLVDRWSRGERVGEMLADRLRLDGDRRERFLVVQRQLAAAVREHRLAMNDLRRDLRAELTGEVPDRARVDALVDRLAGHQAALDRAFVDSVFASRELLSGRELAEYLKFLDRFAAGLRGQRGGAPPPLRLRDRLPSRRPGGPRP
ncbi:MAG: periplasmic heavy metal sensor [Thermoanaerobaculia bacterium]